MRVYWDESNEAFNLGLRLTPRQGSERRIAIETVRPGASPGRLVVRAFELVAEVRRSGSRYRKRENDGGPTDNRTALATAVVAQAAVRGPI